mmetsp:Transcript_17186/g.39626  ORF Transcript_17186/g.39626 Transcript_17186/m.39626 type:complete len:263 (+) Transcript_17186:101-889(+)
MLSGGQQGDRTPRVPPTRGWHWRHTPAKPPRTRTLAHDHKKSQEFHPKNAHNSQTKLITRYNQCLNSAHPRRPPRPGPATLRGATLHELQPPQHGRAPQERAPRPRYERIPTAHIDHLKCHLSSQPSPLLAAAAQPPTRLGDGDLGPQGNRLGATRDGELGELVLQRGDALLEGLVFRPAARQLKLERLNVRLLTLPGTLRAQAILQEALAQLVVHLGQVVGTPLRRGAGGPEVVLGLDGEGGYSLVVGSCLPRGGCGGRYG